MKSNTATDTESREKTIALRKPVKLGEQVWDTLELREPTLGELDRAQKVAGQGAASDIEMLASVTGIPTTALKQIGVSEYREAMTFLAVFINGAPATTEN